MNNKTTIKISQKTLKSCVKKGGDLILEIDVDATKLDHFPDGSETFLRSKKDDKPENYNDDLCLVANQNRVFVNGECFWLKKASKRVLYILYNQPDFLLDYIEFARQYRPDEDINDPERGNTVANSAIKHANQYFFDNNIPLVVKRYNSIVQLEKICEY